MRWVDVDTACASLPVNALPLIDDTDFKSIEAAVVYNQAGLALFWNFTTTAGTTTVTAVTPTTGDDHDWTDFTTSGMYGIEMPASGGDVNNDAEGVGFFTGVATGILPWRGPDIGFRAAALNDALIDGGDTLDVNVTAMAANVLTATAINSDAITAAKIADDAISSEHLNTGALTADAFAADAIVAATLATGAITNDAIAAGALTATEITGAAGCAVSSLGNNVITDASLAGGLEIVFETDFATNYNTTRNAWVNNYTDYLGTIPAAALGADCITDAKIADGAFVAANFAASSLDGKGDWNTTVPDAAGTAATPAEVATALTDIKLDHLVAVADADDVVDDSIIAKLANSGATADWSAYVNTTDSLMAIRDHIGDGTNLSEAGGDGDHLTAINLPNQTMDITGDLSGSVGSVSGAVGSVTGGATEAKQDAAQTDLDTLTDTSAEPTGVPAASATLLTKVGYLYMALRNQVDVTATKKTFYDGGGSGEWEKDLSDNGTTYSESEGNAI